MDTAAIVTVAEEGDCGILKCTHQTTDWINYINV